MARRVRAVSHEDQLSLVQHLDELRARLVVSIAIFSVALALCFWQSHILLEIAGHPLPDGHKKLITFGVTEPFTTTLTVSAYGAAILSRRSSSGSCTPTSCPPSAPASAGSRCRSCCSSHSSSWPGSPSPTSP